MQARQHPLLSVVPSTPGSPASEHAGDMPSRHATGPAPAPGGVAEHIALLDAASDQTQQQAIAQINEGLRLLAAGSAARRQLKDLTPGQWRAAFVARAGARHAPGPVSADPVRRDAQ